MPSTQVDLTDPLPLSLTLSNGDSGLFPRCLVYDAADVLVATRDLGEVGATGRYTDVGFTPVTEEAFVGHFVTFTDAGHTIESTVHGRAEETYTVAAARESEASAATRQTALIAEHDDTQADIAALNDLSQADVQTALTAQGYTAARAVFLDNLDALISSRLAGSDVVDGIATVDDVLARLNAWVRGRIEIQNDDELVYFAEDGVTALYRNNKLDSNREVLAP